MCLSGISKPLFINGRELSPKNPPYIIAEVSANHNGSIERAKETITAAKEAGVSAVKIQTYTPDTMTLNSDRDDFQIKEGLWEGRSLYDLYAEAYTPFEWHADLFQHAKDIGIPLFSTPFDESAVDLLESLKTPAYKIASFEIVDLPLIKYVAKTKKPMLMSTGMANETEIGAALEVARSHGTGEILLFHCISSYPTPIEHSNLNTIRYLKKEFGVEVGLSDHTLGTTAAVASIALGAVAVEKHFTLDRNNKGPDSAFSLEPNEFQTLTTDTENAWRALGQTGFHRADIEKDNTKFRRSIYFVKDLKAGDIISENDIKRIRPGFGLSPKHFDDLIGKPVKKDVVCGEAVQWDAISSE